uniref:Cation/H+ exchanger transmembrane domain-containing protein n=1 Tax=Quercus lobata TaxID=97700 RepID=A0A7N2L416_QUELO
MTLSSALQDFKGKSNISLKAAPKKPPEGDASRMGPTWGYGEKLVQAVGAILSATDSVCTLQVLNQDETPLLYSIVFGEGVVNDATSIVLFNAVQSLDVSNIDLLTALKLLGTFLYLFFTSAALGIAAGLTRVAVTIALSYNQVFGSITKPLVEAVLLRDAKPAHSDATDILSLDDLQILFPEDGDPSDQVHSNEPACQKGQINIIKEAKRKPRKKPIEDNEVITTQSKRPRGRPRKNPIENSLDNLDCNDQYVQGLAVQLSENSLEAHAVDGVPRDAQQHSVQEESGKKQKRYKRAASDVALPRAVLCLAHNGKVAWDVKWRPSNTSESKCKHRMGYLAVLLGNGSLEVWEVPLPCTMKVIYSSVHQEGTDPCFVKLEPVLRCSMLKCSGIQKVSFANER